MSRTRSDLDQVVASVEASGGKASALVCDVTDSAGVRETIAALPRLDILINNAGMNIPEALVDVSEEHLDAVINLNVRAMFIVAQSAVRKMLEFPKRREVGGSVVKITSQMAHVGAARASGRRYQRAGCYDTDPERRRGNIDGVLQRRSAQRVVGHERL